jgi:hypothetical protein
LGKTGLKVSPLAFGGNVFGCTVAENQSFALLDAWMDAALLSSIQLLRILTDCPATGVVNQKP